jgi:integrase
VISLNPGFSAIFGPNSLLTTMLNVILAYIPSQEVIAMDKAKPVKLTDRRVREAKPDPNGKWRRIGDLLCTGLKLVITPDGVKRWVWRYSRLDGKGPTEMGLGVWPIISLDEARRHANHFRDLLAHGQDPQQLKERNIIEGKTLRQTCEEWLGTWAPSRSKSWLLEKRNLLFNHCGSLMDHLPIRVRPEMIDKVLTPVRRGKHPGQAERARVTLVQVFNYAKSRNILPYGVQNPADREIQKHLSPPVPRIEKHFRAPPYQQVSAFIRDLRTRQDRSVAALALELAILTACRTGEVLGARWEEIEGNVWTIPPERLKTKNNPNPKPHRVPLSEQAMAIVHLRERSRTSSPYVFTGPTQERLNDKAMRDQVYDMGFKGITTVHGYRSAFRDWCEERNNFDWAAKEMCLSHKIGKTARAYVRTDLLDKRRIIMQAWASYCG